ncbi:hypothetical protein TNCV_4609751 [Trichonephila clavipes]|nr:hypothetical protein TNCV_4609751 [Trichonephila clavipes]
MLVVDGWSWLQIWINIDVLTEVLVWPNGHGCELMGQYLLVLELWENSGCVEELIQVGFIEGKSPSVGVVVRFKERFPTLRYHPH